MTVTRDTFKLFCEESDKLKKELTKGGQRVCLTTDCWISCTQLAYMCLTAHYIDSDWHLHKKIINFCLVKDHKGETIGRVIETCLLGWGLEKILSVTVDNASANDVAVAYVRKRINAWKGSVLDGEFIHLRCGAHIVNLIVGDGLKEMHDSIASIRNSVRYIRSSSSRLQKFRTCIEREKITYKGGLVLDVPTRWNSTFMMLDAALKFEKAFVRYGDEDDKYLSHFEEKENEKKRVGPPNRYHWQCASAFVKFLSTFYEVTLKFSVMSESDPSAYTEPSSLLYRLEFILHSDPLIDEVGFVHPSQFAALSDISDSPSLSSMPELQLADENKLKASQVNPTDMAFWSRDHKLGISTQAIHPLYNAAKNAFFSSLEQYKLLLHLHAKKVGLDSDNGSNASSLATLECEVMKHSRALLLLSCDFGTAWNCRKEVVSKKQDIMLYLDELLVSTLVLSYSPKSERAWSHRRWVVKMIAGKSTNLQEILKNESELAQRIAEKSKMNYRAWNHRCWLVSYMPENQVIDELIKYRDWSGLHVADNSCFHYRTRLLTRTLADSFYKQDLKASHVHTTAEVYQLWKEELSWSEILIKRYIGREALWLYRRFLALCWIKHFAGTHVESFVDDELQLFWSCTTVPDNVFEDHQSQATFAATYILWLIKQMDEPQGVEIVEKVGEDPKKVLNKVCPEKAFLWDLVRNKNVELLI